jgi:predicted HAD superfamily phosphohydrolase
MTPRKKKKKKKKVKRVKRKKRKAKALKPRTFYTLNRECEFYDELKTLLLKITPREFEKFTNRVSALGGVKLAVASGIFIDRKNSPADLVIVAKRIDQTKLTTLMRTLGIELGKELNYNVMSEKEFRYRRNMYDKFLRIILESPHIKLINKFGYLGKS